MPDTGKIMSPDPANPPVSEPQAVTGSMSHKKELESRRGYCWLSVLNTRGLCDGDFGMSAHTCPEVQQNVADEVGRTLHLNVTFIYFITALYTQLCMQHPLESFRGRRVLPCGIFFAWFQTPIKILEHFVWGWGSKE